MRTNKKLKKKLQTVAILTILLTLLIPTAIGNIDQINKPKDVKVKDILGNNPLMMGQETWGPPQAHEDVELLEPGLFHATVTYWRYNNTPPYEIWKIPMGEIEGCIGIERDMGIESNFFSGTWDDYPMSNNPMRLHATIKNGYINGQFLTSFENEFYEEELYSVRISGFYIVNHQPGEENPGDFYMQLILQYTPAQFVIEGFYTTEI